MIISHHHKFIFYAIPKTASQSIRRALRPHLHKYDWEQCHLYEQRSFPIPELASFKLGHLSYQQISPYLLQDMKDEYFSFCFVRHPVDRFLSYCYFKHADDHEMTNNPIASITKIISSAVERNNVMLRPQASFICDEVGNVKVDFIGRYEDLVLDYQRICKKLDFPEIKLILINESERPVKSILDPMIFKWIREYYAEDYQKFNYH